MLTRYFTVRTDERLLVIEHIKQHMDVEWHNVTSVGHGGWITFFVKERPSYDSFKKCQKMIRRLSRGKPRFKVVNGLTSEARPWPRPKVDSMDHRAFVVCG